MLPFASAGGSVSTCGITFSTPCRRSTKGRTVIMKVTMADTGLPGRPMNHALPSGRLTSPKVSGLPGLVATCHMSSRPSASTAGRT